MKFKLIFLLVFIFLPKITQAQQNDAQYKKATEVLSKALNIPVIHRAFDKIQGTVLRTNSDLKLSRFFDSSPLLQSMDPMLHESVNQTIRQGINKGNIAMNNLNDGLTKNNVELEILDAGFEVLRESGRTEKEIESALIILAEGDVNAYTFSSQNGRLVIVIQKGLIDELTYKEWVRGPNGKMIEVTHINKNLVKAVIAHENGHIKSDHVTRGVQNMAMMSQVFEFFVGESPGISDGASDFWGKMMRKLIPDFKPGDKLPTLRRNSLMDAVTRMNKSFSDMKQTDEGKAQVRSLINDYLDTLIEIVLLNGEMDPEVLRGLKGYRDGQPGMFRADVFQKVFAPVADLISREMETSADMFVLNSLARIEAAGPFTDFGGTFLSTNPDSKNYVEELVVAIKKRLLGNKELYKGASAAELQDLLGADGDHPSPGQRVENLIRYANTLDAMAMNNEFLRLVVTRDTLLEMNQSLQSRKTQIEDEIVSFSRIVKLVKSRQLQGHLKELNKLLKQAERDITDSLTAANIFQSSIIEILNMPGYKGDLKTNPALADLIDFQLGRKIRSIRTIDQLTKALPKAESDKQTEEIQMEIKFLQSKKNQGDDLLTLVREEISKSPKNLQGKELLSKITQTLDSNLDVKQARQLRRALLKEVGYKESWLVKRTHVSVGRETVDIRESSIKKDHLPKKIIDEHLADLLKQANAWSIPNLSQPISALRCRDLFHKVGLKNP